MLEDTDFDINLRNMRPLVLLPNRKPHQSFLQLLHLLIVVQPLHFSFKIICTETERKRERFGWELYCIITLHKGGCLRKVSMFIHASPNKHYSFCTTTDPVFSCSVGDNQLCFNSRFFLLRSKYNNDTTVWIEPHTHLTALQTLF